MSDVTRILNQLESGDPSAAEELLPLVYEELRRLAAQRLAVEQPGQTLQATALVHEAYMRLVGAETDQHWTSRGHFFGAAAKAMRRILIESARRKQAEKRGGDRQQVELGEGDLVLHAEPDRLLLLDETLTRLEIEEPQAGQLVQLRIFAGLSVDQAAESLGMSRATAYRLWTYARAWLRSEMRDELQ